jgi:hypothetical protein
MAKEHGKGSLQSYPRFTGKTKKASKDYKYIYSSGYLDSSESRAKGKTLRTAILLGYSISRKRVRDKQNEKG